MGGGEDIVQDECFCLRDIVGESLISIHQSLVTQTQQYINVDDCIVAHATATAPVFSTMSGGMMESSMPQRMMMSRTNVNIKFLTSSGNYEYIFTIDRFMIVSCGSMIRELPDETNICNILYEINKKEILRDNIDEFCARDYLVRFGMLIERTPMDIVPNSTANRFSAEIAESLRNILNGF